MTRILVIDDHPVFREGLSALLTEGGDITICGEGGTAADALDLCRTLTPDLVLLDLSIPGGGIAALQAMRVECPDQKIAILTASEEARDVVTALRAGALGYLVKGMGRRALRDAILTMARGEGFVAPELAARVLALPQDPLPVTLRTAAHTEGARQDFTPREQVVCGLLIEGLTNKEIAQRTGMQEKTVKHHLTRILAKLQVRNRTEAALILRG